MGVIPNIRDAWLTKDTTPGDIICYRAFLPENYLAEFLGALFLLIQVENWEEFGTDTPEVVAAAFEKAYNKTLSGGVCMPAGAILPFAGASLPDGYLWCDGAQYSQEDYPELYNAIGSTWGGSATMFNVPDLGGKFIAGHGGGLALGDLGGQKTVTLTTGTMPNHDHAVHGHITALAVAPGELVVNVPSLNGVTGSAGGGGAHDNMPPYAAMKYIIKT